MNIQDIIKMEKGTKVYRITNGTIEPFEILGYGRNNEYFFFASLTQYTSALGVYIKTNKMLWASNYEDAKEIMWEQLKDRMKSINNTYFNDLKQINFYE